MADRPIQVGDLVYVARPCCSAKQSPSIFTVGGLRTVPSYRIGYCKDCGTKFYGGVVVARVDKSHAARPVSWLKRIPPIEDLEGLTTQELIRIPTKEPAHG